MSAGEKSGPGPAQRQLGILELDRFSQESLTRWKQLSEDLDELQACLFFGLRPEQRRLLAVVSQRTNLAARPRFDGWAG